MISKLFKNATYNSISWLITVMLSIASTPFFVKLLTVELYGIYILLLSLIAYYNLLDLGLGQGVTKYVSQYLALKDTKRIIDFINCAIIIQIVFGLIGTFLLFFFAPNIIHFFKVSLQNQNAAIASLRCCSFGFFFTMITSTFTAILNGLQRYDLTAKLSVLYNLFLTVFSILVLFISKSLFLLIQINVFLSIIISLVYFFHVKANIPFWHFSLNVQSATLRQLFGFSKYVFFSRFLNLFNNYIIRFFIGGFFGPSAVTYFTIPSKLISAIGGLLSNASIVLFPFASELSSKNDNLSDLKNIYVKSNRLFNFILIPMLLSIAIFSKTILALWMGVNIAEKTWQILSILCFSNILGAITTIPINIILGIGKVKPIIYNALCALLIYVLFLYPSMHIFNLNGVPITMILAAIPGLVLFFYITEKIFLLSFTSFVKDVFGIHIIMMVVAIIIILISQTCLNLYSANSLMMLLLFLIFYYIVLLIKYPFFLHYKFFKQIKGFNR